jgi:hypothetical protein
MNHDQLKSWAERAAAELQATQNAAEEAGSDCPSIRTLLAEYNAIREGRPTWQSQLATPELTSELLHEASP